MLHIQAHAYSILQKIKKMTYSVHALMFVYGCMCLYATGHDHLEIVYIKGLVFCHNAGTVENQDVSVCMKLYAIYSHGQRQLIVFTKAKARGNVEELFYRTFSGAAYS